MINFGIALDLFPLTLAIFRIDCLMFRKHEHEFNGQDQTIAYLLALNNFSNNHFEPINRKFHQFQSGEREVTAATIAIWTRNETDTFPIKDITSKNKSR